MCFTSANSPNYFQFPMFDDSRSYPILREVLMVCLLVTSTLSAAASAAVMAATLNNHVGANSATSVTFYYT